MSARSDLRFCQCAGLALAGLATAATLGGCATSGAYLGASTTAAKAAPGAVKVATVNAPDSDMPDDLGVPLPEQKVVHSGPRLSIDAPLSSIAAAPAGRAVLDHDLPGLCERPEFGMFKGMSLKALAGMSGGRITTAKLNQVQADLIKVNYVVSDAR